jgi:ABC-type dipeptide/oligopeptide/nickel transport system permease component
VNLWAVSRLYKNMHENIALTSIRKQVFRRLTAVPLMLLAITIIVFLSGRFCGQANVNILDAEMIKNPLKDRAALLGNMRQAMGLDVPVHLQYLRWLGVMKQKDGTFSGILQGDLGQSIYDPDFNR